MIRTFTYDGEEYSYIPYEELQDSELPMNYPTRKKEKAHYLDYGCGFDIETTLVDAVNVVEATENTTFSFMYMWQFAIDDLTIIGRTWEEFNELLDRLNKRLHLTEKRKLLVFIHNEKFEFSFMKNRLKWATKDVRQYIPEINCWCTVDTRPDIFSLDDRTVIKATTVQYVEFRDSYVLTQRSLSKLAKDFKLGIKKLDDKGFDYKKKRHNKTPLVPLELAYGINDVQILAKFYHAYVKPEFLDKGFKLPLTMTGIVRDDLKRAFKNLPKAEKEEYHKLLKKCFPDTKIDYDFMLHKLYRGGYTHANITAVDVLFDYLDNLSSYDFKSSYPACLLQFKYPWELKEVSKCKFYDIMSGNYKQYFEDKAVWGVFIIKNVYNKTHLSLDSENKIIKYSDDAIFDNGRLLSASWVKVALTEQDILNYLDFYKVDDLDQWECEYLEEGVKKPLPKFFLDMVLKYYAEKEEAGKHKKEDPVTYAICKAKLNSLYGMLVTMLCQQDTRFNEDKGIIEDGNATKGYKDAVSSAILLPTWGIWCTAYARRNLVKTAIKLGDDNIYNDTDSIKARNTTGCKHIFDEYNDRVRRINKTMYVGKYDRKIFANLGCFDYEGRLVRLKTLGCKRYLHSEVEFNKDTGKYEIVDNATVSGLIKDSLQEFCELNDLDIYETFDSDLDISKRTVFKLNKDVSKKKTATYFDKPFVAELTDYLGETIIVSEKSGCSIVDIPFKMDMKPTFMQTILNEREKFALEKDEKYIEKGFNLKEDYINLILMMKDNLHKKGKAY